MYLLNQETMENLIYLYLLLHPATGAEKLFNYWYKDKVLADYERPEKEQLTKIVEAEKFNIMARNANKEHQDRLNLLDRIGVKITRGVGTMYCALFFTAISLISLPAAIATHDPIVIVGWFAQTFLQLVLLAIILFGQAADSKHTEIRAEIEFEKTILEEKQNRKILTGIGSLEKKILEQTSIIKDLLKYSGR